MGPKQPRIALAALLALLVLATLSGAAVAPRYHAAAATPRQMALGISSLPDKNLDNVDAVTASYGRAPAIWSIWSDWGQASAPFPTELVNGLRDRGIVPMFFWEPVNYPAPDFLWTDLIAGQYDTYIREWAQAAKDWGGVVILRFAHEMDGSWFPWGLGRSGNTAAGFKGAWRHVWNIFRGPDGVGADNVKFLWSPSRPKAYLYPGDAYVDYVGFSAFNWGPPHAWSSMQTTIANRTENAMAITSKPIIIAELGSNSAGGDKAAWITNGYQAAYNAYPQIKAIVYFDVNTLPGQVDWRLVTPPEARVAYRNVVAQAQFQGTMTSPKVTLGLPATNDGTAVPTLDASDEGGAGIAAWYLSESDTIPALTATGWLASPPSSFTLSAGDGVKTVYAWVKDLNGTLSSMASATTTTNRAGPAEEPDTYIDTTPMLWANNPIATFGFHSYITPGAIFECRLDGGEFAACSNPYRSGVLPDGSHTFAVRAVNGTAVDQTPATYSWTVDTTPPQTGYAAVAVRQGAPVNAAPVLVTWQVSDNQAPAGSLRNVIQRRRLLAGGAWGTWRPVGSVYNLSWSGMQTFGNTVAYRIRSLDLAGNWGTWEQTAPIRLLARQEGKFNFSAGWIRHALTNAWGGKVATRSKVGAWAKLNFTGSGVALVTPTGPGQGTVLVCVDPGTAMQNCNTIDLSKFTPAGSRYGVAVLDELTPGSHVLRVTVVSGTVNLDGAIVRQ